MTGVVRGISGGQSEKDTIQVLVIGRSRINLVVVSEIAHRSGLRAQASTVEDGVRHMRSKRPHLVILDGGPDNRDCEPLVEHIAALQRTSDTRSPRVILLSTRNTTAADVALPAVVDEVVAKPITPERLQPVIERLARHKG